MKQLTVLLRHDEEMEGLVVSLHDIGRRYTGRYGLCQRHQSVEFVHENTDAVEQAQRSLDDAGVRGSTYLTTLS